MAKILLLEDNEVNREMLTRRLQRRGYRVVVGGNGTEALPKALSEKPSLILMDMSMPVMDGWEATQQLKANPETQHIPVIALTAHAMAGDREKSLAVGCDEYDTKPVDIERLVSKIEQLLPKSPPSPTDVPTEDLPTDDRVQRLLLSHLRHELCTPINAIIGYSEILLDETKDPSIGVDPKFHETLSQDLQKIYAAGIQLLDSARAVLDPARLEANPIAQDINTFSSTVRLELLTPLSTVIGYCEMLREDASAAIAADLERIHTAAQTLLSLINDIVNLAQQQLQAIANQVAVPYNLKLDSPTTQTFAQTAAGLLQSYQHQMPATLEGTILVVDDNVTNCDLLARQLDRQGYTVATATNGAQALTMLEETPYDLILLDILMPNMNGLDVLTRLKQNLSWQTIPVIMISALDELDSVVRCIEMGAEDYLPKPFNPILLRTKINACLEKKRLQEQQVLYLAQQLIAETTPVPILISRLTDGQILYANSAAGRALGLLPEALLQQSTLDFYAHPPERDALVEALSQNESVYHHEIQCKRADGSLFWVAASMQPLSFDRELTILSALYDISDRKEAEDALRLAEENYRSIFENAKSGIYQSTPDGRFLRMNQAMAQIHGYDSPEAMITAVTHIGQQVYVDAEARDNFKQQLQAEGEIAGFEYQAYQQSGDMIWVSENARVVTDTQGTVLYYEGIVEDVTQRKSEEAALKREVQELRIEIDEVKLAQTVAQITETEYFQDLRSKVQDFKLVDDEASQNDGALNDAALNNDSSPHDGFKSNLNSNPDPGYNSAPDSQQSPSQPQASRSTPKILLVEDNELNRDMLTRRLRKAGYEVAIALNGQEGVDQTSEETPDLILMDMSLPVMDGWEATRTLKGNPQTRHIPVIALTAHAMTSDREKAMAAGCDEYDTKPIEWSRLLGKINSFLDSSG